MKMAIIAICFVLASDIVGWYHSLGHLLGPDGITKTVVHKHLILNRLKQNALWRAETTAKAMIKEVNHYGQSTTKGNEEETVRIIKDQNNLFVSPDDQDLKTITLLSSEPEREVSGKFMEAFLLGYKSFIKDTQIPSAKKDLENYTIEFRQDNEYYYLTFAGDRTPSDSPGI